MADVAWVAGSTQVTIATGTTISATTPAGIADDDCLLAAVFARSAITTLSGWTLLDTTADFTNGTNTQHFKLFRKNTVTTADASTSFTWTQASSGRMGVVYAVARNVDTIAISKTAVSSTSTFSITPTAVTADGNGQLFILFGSTVNSSGTQTPTAPSGSTIFSGGASADYRLAGSYQVRNNGQANSGSFNMAPTGTPSANGLGAMTVVLKPASAPPTTVYASVPSPLSGAIQLLLKHRAVARVSVPSMLGQPRVRVSYDFSGQLAGQPPRYTMTLTTGSGPVVAPISSWQATLQTAGSCYVQCVVPACSAYVDAINAATAFTIRRVGRLGGSTLAYEMASAALEVAQLSQGPTNYTALLSGHSAAFATDDGASSIDRPLVDVRSVATETNGVRVRCAVDWLLRPGMRALLSGTPFIVGKINYYVADGDQYMDVAEAAT